LLFLLGVNRRLLIVEDDAVLRKHLARLFTRHGFEVVHANTCREAAVALRVERFDVLLLDVNLPDGDGLEMVIALDEAARPHHIVVTTAMCTAEVQARATQLRVHRILAKPVDVQLLLAALAL